MLKMNNVYYRYKNKHQTIDVLKDINVNFNSGKFYVIKGRSGSGKTTLLSLLAALDKPTSGEILYKDISLSNLDVSDYRLKTASVIYQSYNLFPLLTIIENVLLPLQIQKIEKLKAQEKAVGALKLVGINTNYYKRYPFMLSGGEQQRVAIARSLASGSEIILADEPTGNLDTENSAAIVSILYKLAHDENKLVITVTHDLEIAAKADEAYEMKDGEIKHISMQICNY